MTERRNQALGGLGGIGVIASLWLPWYSVPNTRTAWQTFTATPSVLLVIGVLCGALSMLELTGRTGDVSQLVALSGAVAVALVGYRIAMPPGPGAVHATWGAYLAFASGFTALIASQGASRAQKRVDRRAWVGWEM